MNEGGDEEAKSSLLNPMLPTGHDADSSTAGQSNKTGVGIQRNDTFTGGSSRLNSSERKVTFDGAAPSGGGATAAGGGPRRTSSGRFTFDGLTRTLTQMSNVFDPDGEFTKAVIDSYVKNADEAQQGDMPLPTGFARKAAFWKVAFLAGCLSIVIAVVAAAFVNMIDEVNMICLLKIVATAQRATNAAAATATAAFVIATPAHAFGYIAFA